MTRIPSSFLITWIVTALVAIGMWLVIPGSSVDREVLKLLAGSSTEISGEGSHVSPWQVLSSRVNGGAGHSYSIVAVKDNLEGIFQSSPHSPIDMAVIFKNLQRLGTKKLACSVLLGWENPDPIGLAAMESSLLDFESVVLAAPVTRGAIMEPLPADFRRASLSVDQIAGDISTLPVVNRVSVPSLIHGGQNAMAGFEVIDSEPSADHIHLLARWDDRIILAFPVVAAIQDLGIKPEDLRIEVGSHLKLGEDGPSIPIDEFGRLAIETVSINPKTDLLDKELIDAETGSKNLPPLESVILCDLRSHADINTRDFNRTVPSSMAKLMQGQKVQSKATQLSYSRINSSIELPILLVLALLLSLAGLLGRRLMTLICLTALAASVFATWHGFQHEIWLPGVAAAVTILVALTCALATGRQRKRTTSMPRLDRLKFDSLEDSDS